MIRSSTRDTSLRVGFSNGEHSGVADVPRERGGEGSGFGPHELLEAALATCMTITAKKSATENGIPLESAVAVVRIDRRVPGEVGFDYSLELVGPISDVQKARLESDVANCPVARTLSGKVSIRGVETTEGR